MFEKYLQKILKEHLGEFIEQLDSRELSVGLFSGKIDIKSLRLKKGLLQKYHLPLVIKHSNIKGLSIKIPWKNLFGSPLVITIESVLILCQFAGEGVRPEERVQAMLELINTTIKLVGQELVEKGKEKAELREKAGLIDRIAYKMLDNLYLSVKNIHIRFEEKDAEGPLKYGYSFGCSLESIDVFAVGPNNEKVFIDRSKLTGAQTLIRKKIEMKNLSIYCNYGEQDFIGELAAIKQQKAIEQKLLRGIYTRQRFNSEQNKNNYILIMNVLGVMDEDHKETLAIYELKLNFQKLIVKLDKEVLNCLLTFVFKLKQLDQKQRKDIVRRQIGKQDDLFFRKYCNAYLSDFKAKEFWSSKDRETFSGILLNLHEATIVQKIKYIVINQMSVAELSKFFAVKGQDLDKGLLEVSKEIKDLEQPRIKIQIAVPQITLYLVNEFSESILELNILNISLSYFQRIVADNKVKYIDFYISSISAVNNSLYILSADQQARNQKFFSANAEITPQMTNITGRVASFNFSYDFETIFKISELFHLREIDNQCRNMAADKMEELQAKVQAKVVAQPALNLKLVIARPKILIRQGKVNWTLSVGEIQCLYAREIAVNLTSCIIVIHREKEEYLFIEPFNIQSKVTMEEKSSKVDLRLTSININFEYFIYNSLSNLHKYLFINKKNQIINKCSRSCEIFLKQNRWKKCFITLLDNRLYGWQNDNEYPLFDIRIRVVEKVKRGKIDILEISNKKKVYEIAFKDQKFLEEWLKVLKGIAQSSTEEKSLQVIQILEDSETWLDISLQSIVFKLNHHKFNKEQGQFDKEIEATTIFQFIGMKMGLHSSIQNNIKKSSIHFKMEDLKFKQNNDDYIARLDKQVPILSAYIISDPTSTENSEQVISVELTAFQYYFNPSALLRLLGFFHDMQQNGHISAVNYEQTLQQQNPFKVLSKVNIRISDVTLIMENIITKLPFLKVSAGQIALSLLIRYYQTVVDGNLRDVSAYDLTNYPQTYFNKKQPKECTPKLIAFSREGENEIALTVKLLSEGSPDILNGVTSSANATITNLSINYTHQVVIRAIDYINNQLLGLACYPQFYAEFYCLKQMPKIIAKRNFMKSEHDLLRMKFVNKLGKQKLKAMINTVKPMMFNIIFRDSELNIISDHVTGSCLTFQLSKTIISNTTQLKDYQTNLGNITVPHDHYLIEFKDVSILLREKGKEYRVSNKIGENYIDFKIAIEYFGGEHDFKFMYGAELQINNLIKADFQISMARINLNERILTNVLKIINKNVFHEDGVNFFMVYEYFEGSESLLNVVIHSELLIIELKLLQEDDSILTEIGGFLYKYDRNPSKVSKSINSKYTIFNFVNEGKDKFKEILTSRKIFGRVSNRGTYYTQLFKENLLISIQQETSFQYTATRDRILKKSESVLSAKEMMAIIDINFILYLQKIKIQHEQTEPLSPVYRISSQRMIVDQDEEITQIKLDKIMLCAEVPMSQIVISVLATVYISIDQNRTQIVVPDLQAFISSTENITCNELSQMKKRTLLKQTHLKILQNAEMTEIYLGKCFFKISINDLKSLHLIYQEVNEKYYGFIRDKRQNFGSGIESVQFMPEQQDEKVQLKMTMQKSPIKKISLKIETSHDNIKNVIKGSKQLPQETSLQLIPNGKQNSPNSPHLSPQSSIQSMTKITVFNLDTIQLMLVDDLNDFLTPLIYINLKLDLNQQHRAAIQFYADYFNLRNTLWEPLIQKNTLLIDFAHNLTIKALDPKEFININIASNFIENILKTINHKELKSSRLFYTSHKIDKDEINSWIIINELGEDVLCQSLDQVSEERGVFVGKGEAQTLNFLSKETVRQFKQKQSEDIFIKLVIKDKMIIKKLKINQLGLKRLNIGNGDSGSIVIIKNLYIDLSKNIKYLTLSSQIIFENMSDITIRLKQSKYNRYIYLLPFKSISLPYYCNLHSILYSSNEDQQHYQNLYNLEHHSKLEINKKLFNITFHNKKLKKYFSFIPLYKITNYLPFGIVINFKIKDSGSLYCSLALSSYEDQEKSFGFLYKSLQDLQASIWIQNYQYTDFFTVKKLIEIRDYNNNILTIKSEIYKESSIPMMNIALMVNYIIRNQTKQTFDVFVDNHWIRDIKQGEYFISENNQISLILNGQKSDSVFLTKKNSTVSLRNKGNEMFKTESDYCLYKNRFQFDTSTQNRINFCISELLPMYVLKNGNNYGIIFKQNGSGVGESQSIQAKSQENIQWFLDVNNKRKTPLFRFTICNNTYEWSCLINVESIKKSYLVLRNKFNYTDIKYFLVNVKKIKETFEIFCKQLTHAEIPYIIRNNTKKYNIFIQNIKLILKTGQQSYFCWQDPSINQRKIKIKLYKSNVSLQKQGMKSRNKQQFINYEIKVDSFEQDPIKSSDSNLDMEVINQINRQIFVFSDDPKEGIATLRMNTMSLELPIRIALINNSFSPVSHICDLTTVLQLEYETYSTNKTIANLKLNSIQLDNQTKPLTYFPVVLSTNIQVRVEKSKFLEVEVMASNIRVSIEEDFITDLTAFLAYLQSLTVASVHATHVLQQQAKQDTFFISKLILPKLAVELQIQTKKFSIETTINLQKPELTSYPWKNVPYPIKTIAFNILSHLSISPWAFISSFGKGLSMLITEQEASKGFEGFFQQLIGGFSNSINGMVGMIVGHDIQKVDNFVDGLNKGLWALGTSISEILPNFQGDYSPINIIKQLGTSVVNLAFKPVTGILRMTLKISEGIKKTTKFQFDFTSKKFKKRFPIIFYDRQETFYPYDHVKSETVNTIRRALMNELKYFYLIDFIQIEYKLRNQKSCLIIGAQQLLLFNMKTDKVIWKLQIQKIFNIQIHNLCTIQFIVNSNMQNSQHERKQKYEVDINSQESVKKVMEIIQRVKKMSSIQL